MRHRKDLLRFMRGMLAGEVGTRGDKVYVTASGRAAGAGDVLVLLQSGALVGDKRTCRAGPLTAGWLKRAMLEQDPFQAQHRLAGIDSEGRLVNLAESP